MSVTALINYKLRLIFIGVKAGLHQVYLPRTTLQWRFAVQARIHAGTLVSRILEGTHWPAFAFCLTGVLRTVLLILWGTLFALVIVLFLTFSDVVHRLIKPIAWLTKLWKVKRAITDHFRVAFDLSIKVRPAAQATSFPREMPWVRGGSTGIHIKMS